MPPMRGVGAGIDREEHALVAQVFVELLAGDARLDHAVEVFGVDRQHPVHVAEIDGNAAERRVDLAFERGADAERNHRHAMGRADAHDRLHLRGRARKHHRVGRLVPATQVVVLQCCSRIARPAEKRAAEHLAERRQAAAAAGGRNGFVSRAGEVIAASMPR